ncbi:MAG: hypothetical protein KA297_01340 [Kofleriaceae bacterium]|nr:hypothetical protein [Kofleriaceae bacterium]
MKHLRRGAAWSIVSILVVSAGACGADADGTSADARATGPGGDGAEADAGSGEVNPDAAGSNGGGGGTCAPPDSVDVGGTCVPSCGGAGGNTCVAADSTMCEGLPALTSHDCARCCTRPSYPAPGPASFHFVFQQGPSYWDAIVPMAQANPAVILLAQNQPPQVPPSSWAAYLSYRRPQQPTAAEVNRLLIDPATAPRFVMFEELHDTTSQDYFVALADELRTRYPQWAGRWGVFLTYGNYPRLAAGIDALLRADAAIGLQLYPRKADYCASASSAGGRDVWLAEQFSGSATVGRLAWIMQRRAALGSRSEITPLFGVGDTLAGVSSAAVFIDRMFYVWATRTSYRSLLLAARGGPGAYKWQDVADTAEGYGVGSAARDQQFAASYQHYAVDGRIDSRLGPVSCP